MASLVDSHSSSSGFVDNWQAGKTLAECNLRMLEEEDSCDITFRCGSEGHVIKAHRYVLISRSCVFREMFACPLAKKSEVSVPDIDRSTFKQLLIYLYTDETSIDADNAMTLLFEATKYGVIGLETQCLTFLKTNLTSENACVILEAAHQFDQTDLIEKALTIIKLEGEKSLQSDGFLSLSHAMVDNIVELDNLAVDEHVIFTVVNNWAEVKCGRQNREVTPQNKRLVLGETLQKVRFPLMKPVFYVKQVLTSGLLTDKERLIIAEYFLSPALNIEPFNDHLRKPLRKTTKQRFGWRCRKWTLQGKIDALCFQCNTNIEVHGCQLYCSNEKQKYKVTVYFGEEETVLNSVVLEETVFSSVGGTVVFDVIFPHPISVRANEWRTVAVRMIGPETYVGDKGLSTLQCDDGLVINFRKSNASTNSTDEYSGQIPSLIYREI